MSPFKTFFLNLKHLFTLTIPQSHFVFVLVESLSLSSFFVCLSFFSGLSLSISLPPSFSVCVFSMGHVNCNEC